MKIFRTLHGTRPDFENQNRGSSIAKGNRDYTVHDTVFALIELLVVIFIIGILASLLVVNFRSSAKTQAARHQAAFAIVSDIRAAQTRAMAGSNYNDASVCGFGVHYLTPQSYLVYAGGEAVCATANRNYQPGTDIIIASKKIINLNMVINTPFSDIFFEPPDPATYINNNKAPGANTSIMIQVNGGGSPPTTITVQSSGVTNITN